MDNKDTYFSSKCTINCLGRLLDLTSPIVMGIINITPDSFYSASRSRTADEIVKKAEKHLSEGAAILDIGAVSTRPGAEQITESEESERLIHALKAIRKTFPDAILSVDTYRSSIARRLYYDFGIGMVNDISAGNLDADIFTVIAEIKVPYVMMHMQGTPATMQHAPAYTQVVHEIISFFSEKIRKIQRLGINDIILDPGFGFGKTIEHNYEILCNLTDFRIFGLPIMVGLSRKSMIYKHLGCTPENALNGTTVLNTIALMKGTSILRVHDVKEAVETVNLFNKVCAL